MDKWVDGLIDGCCVGYVTDDANTRSDFGDI